MWRSRFRFRGFSLVELLVVVAIMSMVIAMILTVVSKIMTVVRGWQ